ncbi:MULTISPECIES: hypothetical protein [Pedobacter]|uniref:Uncharacterized protein n=1 Tax=Pedobacter suwonensis TaxID=332999 RepID=A0A1I0TVL3_9SPHI|nr:MULTISPECIES: hypothetical protein [Pedobacter]SFA54976.1 hypothetical protein SAMN04488511_11455 [Pedobacter suwonensis]
MKRIFYIVLFGLSSFRLSAQRIVIDTRHLATVSENAVARNAAEVSHNELLNKINKSLDNINTNSSSIVIAQSMIYSSLSNVNSALKNGLALRDMYSVCEEIIGYGREMSKLAVNEPYLVLFSEQIIKDVGTRSAKMMTEVSDFVLKEDQNILMDYNSRDNLLTGIRSDLQIIRGLAYGAWKAMYWAKVKGVMSMLNPFQGYINRDRQIVADIISKTKYLKK